MSDDPFAISRAEERERKLAMLNAMNLRLMAKMDRLFRENVRRREAIEKHRRTMEEERIQSYYFDRELWEVIDEGR